jgi:endo-1,4-beta-xylanase
LGVKLSVSELDILAQSWNEFRSGGGSGTDKDGSSTVTNRGLMEQANRYNQYMRLYIENSDIIERVSLWGVNDDKSWRSAGLPLLFDHNSLAKPAYFSFIASLEPPEAEASPDTAADGQ